MSLAKRTMLLRDVYYSLKHAFKNQAECNNVIFDLGNILKLKRRKTHTHARR